MLKNTYQVQVNFQNSSANLNADGEYLSNSICLSHADMTLEQAISVFKSEIKNLSQDKKNIISIEVLCSFSNLSIEDEMYDESLDFIDEYGVDIHVSKVILRHSV